VATYPYPYGFNPLEEGKEDDFRVKAGFKGVNAGWNWDLGTTYDEDSLRDVHDQFRERLMVRRDWCVADRLPRR
jgi:hypothetical protein